MTEPEIANQAPVAPPEKMPGVKPPNFTDKRPSTRQRKRAMLDALKATFGVVAQAADKVGIDRTTHYMWLDKDPKYKQAVLELEELKKDFVESKLLKLIQDGDTSATIHAAKGLLVDRGYVFRQEITGKGGGPIKGEVTHNINFKNSKKTNGETDIQHPILGAGEGG